MIKNLFKKLLGSGNKQEDITMEPVSVHNSMSGLSNSYVYEGTPNIKTLLTKEPPKQVLSEDFPKHQWPISGGWGYSQEDAVVIELDNSWEGVGFEYKFLEYRSYEEAIIFRPKGQQLAGFRFERGMQSLVNGRHGKSYDKITMKVSAFTEDDFVFLKNDWESHNGYENDEVGKQKHLQIAESKKIQYEITGWFDISNFFGKG